MQITHPAPIHKTGKATAIDAAAPAAPVFHNDASLHTQAEPGAVDITNLGYLRKSAKAARLEFGGTHALVHRAITAPPPARTATVPLCLRRNRC